MRHMQKSARFASLLYSLHPAERYTCTTWGSGLQRTDTTCCSAFLWNHHESDLARKVNILDLDTKQTEPGYQIFRGVLGKTRCTAPGDLRKWVSGKAPPARGQGLILDHWLPGNLKRAGGVRAGPGSAQGTLLSFPFMSTKPLTLLFYPIGQNNPKPLPLRCQVPSPTSFAQ